MSKLYFRVYNGAGELLVSTQSLDLAKDVFSASDPTKGPYQFFVGGFMEDLAPFILP